MIVPFRTPHATRIVAIPARDEEAHIERCLTALAGQVDHAVVLVNNSTDTTAERAASCAARLGLAATVAERWFPPDLASAGHARRAAMALALELAPHGILFTTDADACVSPDWAAASLRHIAGGADAVAGRALIDPVDAAAIPARLHEDDARECAYAAVLDELAARIDPDPADPWPRHTEHSGASICVRAELFRAAGGIPAIPAGEDRAFFEALRSVDAAVRHAREVTVTVSGRIVGRASGGMADTIRRRMERPDPFLDDALEPADTACRRARLRAHARRTWLSHHAGLESAREAGALAHAMALPVGLVGEAIGSAYFGAFWAGIEGDCPMLLRQPVPVAHLPAQLWRARSLLASTPFADPPISPARTTNPSGMSRFADARLG